MLLFKNGSLEHFNDIRKVFNYNLRLDLSKVLLLKLDQNFICFVV